MTWKSHMEGIHNLFDYLEFMMYLREKDEEKMTGIEKYAKEKIETDSHEIFPSNI